MVFSSPLPVGANRAILSPLFWPLREMRRPKTTPSSPRGSLSLPSPTKSPLLFNPWQPKQKLLFRWSYIHSESLIRLCMGGRDTINSRMRRRGERQKTVLFRVYTAQHYITLTKCPPPPSSNSQPETRKKRKKKSMFGGWGQYSSFPIAGEGGEGSVTSAPFSFRPPSLLST